MLRRYGKYEAVEEIGRGGFGRVYRAYDPGVGRAVAIKVLSGEGDPSLIPRFRAEAMAAGNLHHKNIVTIHEFGEDNGELFLVMEYLDGTDLQEIINRKTQLTLLEKTEIMTQVAQGLQCAHEHGVVHRDIKPANIMRLSDGSVKIMDFGIARLTGDAGTRLTQAGFMIGTLRYMAPEQFSSGETDALCDIWAYGVLYYELITGTHPFDTQNPGAMMYSITRDIQKPMTRLAPECPPELEAVVNRLLEKEREDRYQSLEDLLLDVGPILGDLARKQLPSSMEEARKLMQTDSSESALPIVRRILEVDPTNTQARQWREELRERARSRTVRPRVDDLVRQANEEIQKRDYVAALEKIDSALRLEPSATLHSRLKEFREEAERMKRAGWLVAEARKELQQSDLTGAFERLKQALVSDPKNSEAASLLGEVRKLIASREQKANSNAALNKAKGLIVMQAYDEAISLLTELAPDVPATPEIQERLAEAKRLKQAQDAERSFQVAIGKCKNLMKSGEYQGAVDIARETDREFPDKKDVVQPLLKYALEQIEAERQRSDIERLERDISAECESKNFRQSLILVQGGLKRYPEAERLLRLRESVIEAQTKNEIALGVQRCRNLCVEKKLDEALSLVNELAARYPGTESIAAVNREVTQQIRARSDNRGRDVQKALSKANALIDSGNASSATRLLNGLAIRYPSEESVRALLERSRAQEHKPGVPAQAELRKDDEDRTKLFAEPDKPTPIAKPPDRSAAVTAVSNRSSLAKMWVACGGIALVLAVAGIWTLAQRGSHASPSTTAKADQPSSRIPIVTHPPIVTPEPTPAAVSVEPKAQTAQNEKPNQVLRNVPGVATSRPAKLVPPSRPIAPVKALSRAAPPASDLTKPTQPPAANVPPVANPPVNAQPTQETQAVVSKSAPTEYHGPPELKYAWQGSFPSGQTVTIRGGGASVGTVRGGAFPAAKGYVRIQSEGVSVVQQPSSANGFQLVLRNTRPNAVEALRFTWVEGSAAP